MKNKLWASIALGGLLAFNSAQALTEGELSIWIPGDKSYDGVAKAAEKFTKDTGIKVKVEHPDQLEVKFQQIAASGQGPDLFMWAHDRWGEWVKAGLMAPLEVDQDYLAKFQPFAFEALKFDKNYYGYPVAIEAVGLICNKKIIDKVPGSFEGFIELDKQYKAEGKKITPIMWDYMNSYFSYALLAANGGYSYKKTFQGFDVNDVGVNNEGSKKGLQFIADMVSSGVLPKGTDYGIMESSFAKGNAACIISGPWAWGKFEGLGMDVSVHLLPNLNNKISKPFVGVLSLGINASSPNKDYAKIFVEQYLLTDEGLAYMDSDKPLGAVALKSFQKKLEQDPKTGRRVAVTLLNAANGDIMPNIPEMNKFWSAMQMAIRNATTGRQSVEEALATAESRIKN